MSEYIKELNMDVRQKRKIYIDLTCENKNYVMGQRLTSFFGQSGIFENMEKILDPVQNFFNSIELGFLHFDLDNDFEEIHFSNYLPDQINLESLQVAEEDEDEVSSFSFFVPIIIFFYFSEKQTNSVLLMTFSKNYQKNIHKFSMFINYLKYKESVPSFLKNKIYLKNIQKYIKSFYYRKNFNFFKTKFYDFFNLTNIDFIKKEDLDETEDENFSLFIKRKKNKLIWFKRYRYKLNKLVSVLIKKTKWLSNYYLLNIVSMKVNFLDRSFFYSDFFSLFYYFASQLTNLKRRFYRRIRRRKRFKKLVYRNFFGEKINYYKMYKPYEGKNKKKRR